MVARFRHCSIRRHACVEPTSSICLQSINRRYGLRERLLAMVQTDGILQRRGIRSVPGSRQSASRAGTLVNTLS